MNNDFIKVVGIFLLMIIGTAGLASVVQMIPTAIQWVMVIVGGYYALKYIGRPKGV